MTHILKFINVSGATCSDKNNIYGCYSITQKDIETKIGAPIKIFNKEYFDGTHHPIKIHPSSSHWIYGSGGAILNTNLGEIAVWGEIEGDPNPLQSHANGAPHINLYYNANYLKKRKKPPKKVHITKCKKGWILTLDSNNNIISKCPVKNK